MKSSFQINEQEKIALELQKMEKKNPEKIENQILNFKYS